MSHIQNIDAKEWNEIKWFIRGFVAGVKNTRHDWRECLEDLWHAWDNTLDLNFLVDGDEVTCTAYAVASSGYTDPSTFERVDYHATDEVLA